MPPSLPLAPIEEYMFRADQSANPMCFYIRLGFCGQFDRHALEKAFGNALQWHPLLTSRIVQTARGRLEWVPVAESQEPIHWISGKTGEDFPRLERIDLKAERGIRLAVVESTERSDLILQVHHSCADGLGFFQFIADLLDQYARVTGSPPMLPDSPKPLPEALSGRGTFGLTSGQLLRLLPKQLVGLDGARKFFLRKPIPLVPVSLSPGTDALAADFPAILTRQLSVEELRQLKRAASDQGVTANELMIRALFMAIDQWQRQRVPGPEAGWLRILIPLNMRTLAKLKAPAANLVSLVFLHRSRAELKHSQELLNGIHRELQLIRRFDLGLTFPLSLYFCKILPGGLAKQVDPNSCRSTCIFSNLGTVLGKLKTPYGVGRFETESLRLETIEIANILPPHNHIAFTSSLYARKFFITLHYDSRVISKDGANSLFDNFMRLLPIS